MLKQKTIILALIISFLFVLVLSNKVYAANEGIKIVKDS